MATQSTAKKQPFVIEPLNWVAPASNDHAEEKQDSKQAAPAEELQD